MAKTYTALGMMSGTSMDGVDAAILTTDGEHIAGLGPWLTAPYDEAQRARLRSVMDGADAVAPVEREITEVHEKLVNLLLEENNYTYSNIDVIGFHGQTIFHRPNEGQTRQIGDGALLARRIGIDVVNDFRSADIAAGGQGAPLAPLYHWARARDLERPLCVLNIGGLANITWIGPGQAADGDTVLAFDTGPGNALLDDWMLAQTGTPLDRDGAQAARGEPDEAVLGQFLGQPFFRQSPPKSLDRNDFSLEALAHLGIADGAATLVALTCRAVARAAEHFPAPVERWLVSGGGRHNPALMAGLREILNGPVGPVEEVGWRGDALEAEAFAFLAVRSLRGLPLTLPGTTGVAKPLTGGTLHRAPARAVRTEPRPRAQPR